MNCTRAKSEIALWTGGDLDDRETAQLERHVAVCPDCREYRQRMSESLQVLQRPAATVPGNLHDSVWPNVQSRLSLQSQREFQRAERLNRWLPAAAVAAACLALIAFTSEPVAPPQDIWGEALPSNLQSGSILAPPNSSVSIDRNRQPLRVRPVDATSPGLNSQDGGPIVYDPLWPYPLARERGLKLNGTSFP